MAGAESLFQVIQLGEKHSDNDRDYREVGTQKQLASSRMQASGYIFSSARSYRIERGIQKIGRIASIPILGGLHHQDVRL